MDLLTRLEHAPPGRDPLWRFPAEQLELPLSELLAQARRIAAALSARGVTKGDRVIVMFETGAPAVLVLLALWRLGAVPVPLRPVTDAAAWLADPLARIERICDARCILHGGPPAPPDAGAALGKPVRSLAELDVAQVDAPPIAKSAPDDLALIQFTSGSTGQPRGVMVDHRMVSTQLEQLAANYDTGGTGARPQSFASWLPICHDMGLFIGMLTPLYLRADALLAPPDYYVRNPGRWFAALSAIGCDLTFSTSSVLAATLRGTRRLRPGTCDLSRLVLYIAAEKVSPAVLDQVAATLVPLGLQTRNIRIGYGMAEYALGCTATRSDAVRRLHIRIDDNGHVCPDTRPDAIEIVSVGTPNPECEIVIRDGHGQTLPDWRLGEITIAGPCLTRGYYNDPVATRRALTQGYLRTGDLGFRAGGEIYFVERRDEMLHVGGRNIIPADVEMAVEALPFVGHGRAVLFGLDAPQGGTARQVLLIESVSSAAVFAERLSTIRKLVRDRFGFVPTDIESVPRGTVEKTTSGKKRTMVIRQRWRAGTIG